MKKNLYIFYLYPAFIIGFFLVGMTVKTAENLSGKFFPENSPMWVGYYPNDFLPWGVFIFLYIGFVTTIFLLNRIKRKFMALSALLLCFLPYILIRIVLMNNISYSDVWGNLFMEIIDTCGWSQIVGYLLGVFVYQMEKNKEKGVK